jgi:hypothetical protein
MTSANGPLVSKTALLGPHLPHSTARRRLDWQASALGGHSQADEFGDNPALVEAIAVWRRAAELRPRSVSPDDFGTAMTGLGNALVVLGERETGTTKLEEAVAAYREALTERTRERAPLQWALSFGSEGVALMRLAERRGDAAMAETALSQINMAFETLRDGGHAQNAAYYERQLPTARAVVERLRER